MRKPLLIFSLCVFVHACSFLPRNFLSVHTELPVPFNRVLEEIGDTRVLFVGELHGDRKSHAVELAVIQYLQEEGIKVVIAFEMFPHSEQKILNQWIVGAIHEELFIVRYNRIVNLPFKTYKNIFRYARDNRIPIVGINAEKNLISAVSKGGIENAPEPLLKELKFSPCSDNEAYSRMLGFSDQKQYHQNLMTHLCDGQRLRDAHMAYYIADILNQNEDDVRVVVMTGVMHAIKAAVPAMLQKQTAVSYRVLIPEKARYMIHEETESEIADYLWY